MESIGVPWNGLQSIGYHCFPFQWSVMDTIALDTTRFIVGGAAGVADTVTECHVRSREAYVRAIRRLWRFYGRRKGGKRGPQRPVAHVRSPRDNQCYRALNARR